MSKFKAGDRVKVARAVGEYAEYIELQIGLFGTVASGLGEGEWSMGDEYEVQLDTEEDLTYFFTEECLGLEDLT